MVFGGFCKTTWRMGPIRKWLKTMVHFVGLIRQTLLLGFGVRWFETCWYKGMGLSAEVDVETLVWKSQPLMVQLKVWHGYVTMYTAYEIFKHFQIMYIYISIQTPDLLLLSQKNYRRTCASRFSQPFSAQYGWTHPQAWQWSPAPPHVAQAAVHGTEAVRSAALKAQGLTRRDP